MADQKRVVICDDDPVILRLLQVNLELEGFDVLLAHNGEAVEVGQKERPDLIILDIMMPRMDGYEACQHLRRIESTNPAMARVKTTDDAAESLIERITTWAMRRPDIRALALVGSYAAERKPLIQTLT